MKNCKIVSCGKKTAVMALAVSVGAMLMTGCSTSASASGSTASAGKPVVTVWAGGSDNVRVQFEKQIQQFNASQDQYTAELQFITSGTGAQGLFERVVAAKKAGQTDTDYDVIELGGDEVTKYVDEGGEDFFVPLDKSKIPNIDTLQVESTFRNDLVMPYRGTTVVTVSYTHLDVYKRQGIGQGYKTVFISQRDAEAVFFCFYKTEKERGSIRFMFWNGSEPGTQGKLKAVSIQDPVEDRPAGHTCLLYTSPSPDHGGVRPSGKGICKAGKGRPRL